MSHQTSAWVFCGKSSLQGIMFQPLIFRGVFGFMSDILSRVGFDSTPRKKGGRVPLSFGGEKWFDD